jgi:protoheme IX farnesyltransferase
MLPVIVGPKKTAQQIIVYSVLLVFVTFWLVPVANLGWIYTGSAAVLGAWMLFDSVRLLNKPDTAMNLFRTSTIYLSLLFAAIWVDIVI